MCVLFHVVKFSFQFSFMCKIVVITCRFSEVATLRDVCWLDIRGKLETHFLSPKTTYIAYLVFKVAGNENGLENLPAKAWVGVVGERAGDEDWDEDENTSSVYLKFRPSIRVSRAAPNGVLPQGREDWWINQVKARLNWVSFLMMEERTGKCGCG